MPPLGESQYGYVIVPYCPMHERGAVSHYIFGGLRIPAKVVIAQAGCRRGRDFSLAAVMLNRRACSYRRALEEVSYLQESSCLGFALGQPELPGLNHISHITHPGPAQGGRGTAGTARGPEGFSTE